MAMFLGDIKRTMLRYRDPDRTYKRRIPILSVDSSAAPGTKTLQFQATVKPSKPGENYTTVIRFHEVSFHKEKINTKHVAHDVDGVTYYHAVPSAKRNPVRLRCSCQSMRFEFEKQLFDAGALIGNWRRYRRKTPPAVRPPNARNPNPHGIDFVNALPHGGDDVTGWCIHVHALLNLLYREGKVRN